jgi:hypothetical protein
MDMGNGPKADKAAEKVDEEMGSLLAWTGAHFEQEDGATARQTQEGLPYYTVRLAARKDGRAWGIHLIHAFQEVLEGLRSAGARKIIWRTRPYLAEDDQMHYIRARLVTLDDLGNAVLTPHAVKENQPTPEIPYPEQLQEMPPLGYDFLGPREEAVVLCAMIAYQVTKALNDSRGEFTLSWDQSRASTVAGVMAILDNPNLTPEQSHASWMEYKRADGWQLGPTKDPAAKTHPLLVPYDMLPDDQKVKDAIFGAIVRTFFGI